MGASIGTIGAAPEVMIANAFERFDADGNLTDDVTKQLICQLLQNLVELDQANHMKLEKIDRSLY